jgi:protein involved in polysaccharide export with SLBB domain
VFVFLFSQKFNNKLRFGVVLAILAVISSPSAQDRVDKPRGTDTSYLKRIHIGDLIDIHVAGHLEYDWRGKINPEGFIDGFDRIPKQIFALCRSEAELSADITSELSGTLREPKTEIKIVDISQRPIVSIEGAIATPTRFQVKRPVSLSELIVSAGGITDRSSGMISIVRPAGLSCIGNAKSTERFDIEIPKILAGHADANPNIVSGDIVFVGEASPIFLVGAVATQGKIEYRPEMTISRAISTAGGATKEAVTNEIKIFRRSSGATEAISVDLQKIAAGTASDVVLRPFDIIDLPFKGKPPRRLPPIAEIEQFSTVERTKYPLRIIE